MEVGRDHLRWSGTGRTTYDVDGSLLTVRYELLVKIASGGMGAVYVGRLRGELGFEQLVAVKRPHAHLFESRDVKRSLMAEARVASRIRHANVVGVRDVEATDDSVLLVMDYVEGASLFELMARPVDGDRTEIVRAGLRILLDVCAGLQAVHDLTDSSGESLALVHRDVSPHNMLVGVDGVGRLTDFGIAKSLNANDPSTREGTIKGKLAYMAPEYLQGTVDQRSDLFSMGIVLWELLVGRRLFAGGSEGETVHRVLMEPVPLVSVAAPDLGSAFDDVVSRALDRRLESRIESAAELQRALETAVAADGRRIEGALSRARGSASALCAALSVRLSTVMGGSSGIMLAIFTAAWTAPWASPRTGRRPSAKAHNA